MGKYVIQDIHFIRCLSPFISSMKRHIYTCIIPKLLYHFPKKSYCIWGDLLFWCLRFQLNINFVLWHIADYFLYHRWKVLLRSRHAIHSFKILNFIRDIFIPLFGPSKAIIHNWNYYFMASNSFQYLFTHPIFFIWTAS